MSRFSGPQGQGARRKARELRMFEAAARQIGGMERGTTVRDGLRHSYAPPADFLSDQSIDHMTRGVIDVDSLRTYWPRPS